MSRETIAERLGALRAEMASEGLDAYLITGTDAHSSEYVCPHWRTREWATGFTGSAGTVLVTMDRALLWTDSRYYIQAAAQTGESEVELMKDGAPGVPAVDAWIKENLKGKKVGTCAAEISIKALKDNISAYSRHGITFEATDDLVGRVWEDRPAMPSTKIRVVPDSVAGLSRRAKLDLIAEKVSGEGCDFTLTAGVDDIAWATNLRADDVECNPVFLSFMYVSKDKRALFTDLSRFTPEILSEVEEDMLALPYGDAASWVGANASGKAYYDDTRVNSSFMPFLDKEGSVTGRDKATLIKARKNKTELAGMRKAHVLDGAAYVNCFSKIDFSKTDGTYDEIAIARAFETEREKMEGYLGPSFNPISGFGPNGAMCHYSANEESNAKIDRDGLLVLDTGSQFLFGMTDLTRTLLFGEATREQKKDYTLVLKGHLALARARFIEGTRGIQLDVLAKQFLWNEGESFFHGTGHGVGFNLNVHEGPMNISARMIDVALEEGMVVSDEPGVYKEGRHGVRIENLIAVREDRETEFGRFLSFETLSLAPYERRLIDVSLLTDEEISQIDAYHVRVKKELAPYIDPEAKAWLEAAAAPLAPAAPRR